MSKVATVVACSMVIVLAASVVGRAQGVGVSASGSASASVSETASAQTASVSDGQAGEVGLAGDGGQDSSLANSSVQDSSVADSYIAALPVNAREWESLGLLASEANGAAPAEGVSGDAEADLADGRSKDASDAGAAASGLSFGGVAVTQNAALLDGLSMEQSFRSGPRGAAMGGSVSGTSFGQSAVRSFRVMPSTYSAEFGGAAGAVLAIRSQAGEERLHGGATLLLRASAFAAANPYAVATQYQDGVITSSLVKPEDTVVQLAGHVGMPLGDYFPAARLRKRLTMFASYEAQWRNDPVISSPATAEFYALTPMQVDTLANRGVTASATNAALNYLDSLTGEVARSSTRGLGFVRVDDKVSARDHVAVTYAKNYFDSPAGTGYSSASNAVVASGRESVGDSVIDVDAVAAHWLHAFGPRFTQALRGQWVRDLEYDTARTPLAQEPAIGPGGFAPEVEIAPDGFTYGTPAALGRTAYPDEARVQLADTLELVRGRHVLRVGGDWSRVVDRIASYANPEGTFLYDSGILNGHAGGLVDWITDYTFNVNATPNGGCPTISNAYRDPALPHYFCFRSFTQSFGAAQTEFVTHEVAGFVEDAFRARKDLRFTIGVRYEYTLLPLPQTPNVALDEALQSVATQVVGATSSFPEDRNNIGPRLSAAWMPKGGRYATVHVGYGIFYGRLTGTTVRSALADTALPTTTTQIRIRPTTETVCPQVSATMQGFGYPCAFVAEPPAAVAETSSAMLFAKNFRLPAVQRASLSVEREVGKHVAVKASYAMAVATQLPGSVDLNVAPATATASYVLQGGDGHVGLHTGETFVVPLYTERRWSQYGPVSALVSNANATYHAGTIEAELRGVRSLELRGSFTFSRAIDYAPQLSATPGNDSQFDPFRKGYDKGLSTLQFPERFSGDAIYRVKVEHGPWVVREGLNGWHVAAIATAGSGAPYSYEISGGTYLSGGHETINGSGGATYLPTVGRNTLRLAARGSVDARLERGFALRKGARLNGFVEAFNLLNERNLSRVETRAFLLGTPLVAGGSTPLVFQDAATIAGEELTTPAFGAPTSSTTGVSRERQMELGVRVEF